MSRHGMALTNEKHDLLKESSTCFWCKKQLVALTATVDHIIPTHKGGKNNKENYVLACEPCNNTRSVIDQILLGYNKGGKLKIRERIRIHIWNCKESDPIVKENFQTIRDWLKNHD